MNTEQFAKDVVNQSTRQVTIERRMNFARQLAATYCISRPEMILFFTDPQTSRLPLYERCRVMNITEEEYMLTTQEEGWRRFMKDFEDAQLTTVRSQALTSTGAALTTDRFTYDKNGNANADHTLEIEAMKGLTAERVKAPSVTVNLQSNVWSDARKLAGG